MRYDVAGFVIVIAASMACSRGPQRTVAASPTSPTAVTAEGTITFAGGVSGPMDVLFPGRADSFQFRNEIETKYQTSLNRTATMTFVDREGEVVWMQEYIRYRANGCDHGTAVTRVMAQIDGGAAGGICLAPPENTAIAFPSRADVFEFRRALETKYQQMGRGLGSSFLDPEGSGVWIPEYLRYRTNSCDHATAVAKVFSQIDGGPVPATCFVPTCSFVLNPSGIETSNLASTQTFQVRPNPGGCSYTAASDSSWLTFASDLSTGSQFTDFPYAIAANNGAGRTGRIRFAWTGGGASYTVFQQGTPFNAGFTLVDPFRSTSLTNECHIRSTNTPCNFTAFANLPGGSYVYTWQAIYTYGTSKIVNQVGASPNFSFSDVCGGTGATATGAGTDLTVTLTITDSLGNSITLRSGEGNQAALSLRLFTC